MEFVKNKFYEKQGKIPNAKILKVERIQNENQYNQWKAEFNKLKEENGKIFNKQQLFLPKFLNSRNYEPKVLYLWHGTRKTDPKQIFSGKSSGFDLMHCKVGLWGQACYFARDFKYSAENYSYELSSETRQIFLVKVIVGETIQMKQKEIQKSQIPKIPNTDIQYDSVNSEDGNIYVIYDFGRAYPEYLIDFQL